MRVTARGSRRCQGKIGNLDARNPSIHRRSRRPISAVKENGMDKPKHNCQFCKYLERGMEDFPCSECLKSRERTFWKQNIKRVK
jgi:hypothetical protein